MTRAATILAGLALVGFWAGAAIADEPKEITIEHCASVSIEPTTEIGKNGAVYSNKVTCKGDVLAPKVVERPNLAGTLMLPSCSFIQNGCPTR